MKEVIVLNSEGMPLFWCPGCKRMHGIWLKDRPNLINGAWWDWNGDLVKPTFTPSILGFGPPRCHCFVTDGKIQFLSDCEHALAGQTAPLPADPLNQK